MSGNDFQTDIREREKIHFSSSLGTLLTVSIFLTGLFSISGIYFIGRGIYRQLWKSMGLTAFSWKVLIYICVLCCFVSLIKIAVDEKPFSGILSICVRAIGILIVAASVIFPRFSDYQSSGFEIFSIPDKNFVLIDGTILLVGILFCILAALIKEGFRMQTEIDEIL